MAVSAVGCAPSRKAAIGEVGDTVESRSGHSLAPLSTEGDEEIQAQTLRLLEKELDVTSAVQVGLLNNRRLRATLEEVGVARAELISSGLPENPKVSAGFFQEKDEDSGTLERYGVSQDITSLFLSPLRKRGLNAQLDAHQFRASHEALEVVAEMKKGFYSMQAAQSNRDLFEAVVRASDSASELARRQFEAGNINQLTLAFQEALAAEAALEFSRKQTEMEIARAQLAELLGIQTVPVEWTIVSTLPNLPDSSALPSNLEEIALKQRLDLESNRREMAAWQKSKAAARASMLPPIELGLAHEEEIEGTLEGTTIEAQVPLFNRGQGDRANADAQVRRAREVLAASESRVRKEVRTAAARVQEAHRAAELIQNRILPLRERIVEETQLHYNFMLQGVYQLLEAKREELKAREDVISTLRDFWIAWTDLERTVGGTFEVKETSP